MNGIVLGIDLGTSGVKVGMLDLASLELENVVLREYDPSPEQNTADLFESTLDALSAAVSTIQDKTQIKAIGLSGQMHGAVLFDQSAEIMHPLVNWQERKYSSTAVVEEIKEILGPEGSQDTGIDMAAGLTGAILFGMRENYPDLFARIDKFVLPTDFIRGKLLGRLDHATDPTNAFGTGLFHTRESRWHQGLIQELGLPLDIFPDIHPSSQIAGYLCPDIASSLGLAGNIAVIYGGGDNQMSMLGSGLISPSSPPLINIGTSAQISMLTADYLRIPGVDTRSYFEGAYAFVGASLAGGGSYQWLRDQIRVETGREIAFEEMDRMAAQVPPGAQGLLFCPGPSRRQPRRKLGFYGNRALQNSIGHQSRAVMESVIFDLYECYLGFSAYDNSDSMIGAGKGLQRSKIWSQIAVDIFQKTVRITNFENALFGAALMAAVAVGALPDLESGTRAIQYDRAIRPNPAHGAEYQRIFIHR
jgi:xylulokinase